MNNQLSLLRRQAIQAAKDSQWQTAVELNQSIVGQEPADTGALNRLGMALVQIGQTDEAQKVFKNTLEIDKTNVIAKKQLTKLKNNWTITPPTFSQQSFIEEPGKTKTIELHRLAGRKVLETLSLGQTCSLKSKNRYISVETGDQYVGALPEDVSFRLTKLINSGNEYSCMIYSTSDNTCRVYLKEEFRSKKNTYIHSFPPAKLTSLGQEVDERYLFDDDSPADLGDSGDELEEETTRESTKEDRDYLE
jgi:tetratricopeptide (TPR) repeat protein